MVEKWRLCGARKIGGLYLVGGGIARPCDRLPYELCICPTCSQGIKQARGFTWIDVGKFFQGPHLLSSKNLCNCTVMQFCPLCTKPELLGRAGLLWIGLKFYKTPSHFIQEGKNLGFSRRVAAIPHGFEIGRTWVMLAHPKAVVCGTCNGAGWYASANEKCEDCEAGRRPGIFYAWLPSAVELIFKESQRGSDEVAKAEKRGIRPVFVPDDDPDHQGSIWDKNSLDKQEETDIS